MNKSSSIINLGDFQVQDDTQDQDKSDCEPHHHWSECYKVIYVFFLFKPFGTVSGIQSIDLEVHGTISKTLSWIRVIISFSIASIKPAALYLFKTLLYMGFSSLFAIVMNRARFKYSKYWLQAENVLLCSAVKAPMMKWKDLHRWTRESQFDLSNDCWFNFSLKIREWWSGPWKEVYLEPVGVSDLENIEL